MVIMDWIKEEVEEDEDKLEIKLEIMDRKKIGVILDMVRKWCYILMLKCCVMELGDWDVLE